MCAIFLRPGSNLKFEHNSRADSTFRGSGVSISGRLMTSLFAIIAGISVILTTGAGSEALPISHVARFTVTATEGHLASNPANPAATFDFIPSVGDTFFGTFVVDDALLGENGQN